MNEQVWKYEIPNSGKFQIDMPYKAVVLSVFEQNKNAYMWVMVNPYYSDRTRTFYFAPTGEALPTDVIAVRFIGTCLMFGGELVYHLFETTPFTQNGA